MVFLVNMKSLAIKISIVIGKGNYNINKYTFKESYKLTHIKLKYY